MLQALLATQEELQTFPETHFFSTVFKGRVDFSETIDFASAEKVIAILAEKFEVALDQTFVKEVQALGSASHIRIKDFFESLVRKICPEARLKKASFLVR